MSFEMWRNDLANEFGYSSRIFLNGVNTISTYNICEDSLLAVPLMIDMVLLAELFSRIN